MKRITRMFLLFALTLGMFRPVPASASSSDGFCFKAGDYFDIDHQGWHVIECWNEWGGGWQVDIYYIKHGVKFEII